MAKAAKRQIEIPGAERQGIPDIDEVAGPYTEKLYAWQELQKEVDALREQLITRMEELNVEKYEYVDGEATYKLRRTLKSRLSCKREKGAPI